MHTFILEGNTQVPFGPVHVWHVPQADAQQRPSVQRFDWHWLAVLQALPLARSARHIPPIQVRS